MTTQDNKTPVDLDMLTMALQAGELDTGWWLDSVTGEVIPEPDPHGNAQEKAILESRQVQPERYIDIEPLPMSVLIDLMESFICTIEDHGFCSDLRQALENKQPAWHFKGVLAANPEHEDSWYAFKEQFFALQARQWTREQGLEYEVKNVVHALAEKNDRFAQTLDTSNGQVLLVLAAPHEHGRRRYIVWQSPEQSDITLTVYYGTGESSEQIIGETGLDQKQMEGINHVLGQVKADISLPLLVGNPDAPQAQLQINTGENQITINSEMTAGTIHDQLQTLFNFLLGISPPE